jgi:hypothetical protein
MSLRSSDFASSFHCSGVRTRISWDARRFKHLVVVTDCVQGTLSCLFVQYQYVFGPRVKVFRAARIRYDAFLLYH